MTKIHAYPDCSARVQASFERQGAMHLIGAQLAGVAPGSAEIHLPVAPQVAQQHGFVHGGVVGMIADSAAGYAAMTGTPPGASVMSVEYKINFLAPAAGEKLIARGSVRRAGRTLVITQAEVFALSDGVETLCALLQQTIIVVHDKPEGQA